MYAKGCFFDKLCHSYRLLLISNARLLESLRTAETIEDCKLVLRFHMHSYSTDPLYHQEWLSNCVTVLEGNELMPVGHAPYYTTLFPYSTQA